MSEPIVQTIKSTTTAEQINLPQTGKVTGVPTPATITPSGSPTVPPPHAPITPRVTNAGAARPAAVGPAKAATQPAKPPGNQFHFSSSMDVNSDVIVAVKNAADKENAGVDDVKDFVTARLLNRGHKIAQAHIHVFDSPDRLTVHVHIQKVT